MCDVVEENEAALATLLEEMSGIGRSMLALNSLTFYEFQRRNQATHDVMDPPAGHFEQALVSKHLLQASSLLKTCCGTEHQWQQQPSHLSVLESLSVVCLVKMKQ